MSLIHVNWVDQFKKEVMDYKWVVVLDFWAEWCGPCRMIWPIMEELEKDNAGKNVKIVKVNVDENNELASQFQVSSIPAVFIIKDWEHLDTVIWANPKNIYQWKIDKCLG